MSISKKIIACAVVCVTLGVGGTAYATSSATNNARFTPATVDESVMADVEDAQTDDVFTENNATLSTIQSAATVDESVMADDEDAQTNNVFTEDVATLSTTQSAMESIFTANEDTQKVEAETCSSRFNIPSENDEICGEYFVHTYSNGQQARIPFDSEIERNYTNIPTRPIDVNALKELGSNEPLTSEISYEVVEFLDGTKRYFKLGEAPLAFRSGD